MATYEESIQCAIHVRKQPGVDTACEHLGRSIWKMKQRYQELEKRKQSRTIIVLDEIPVQVKESKHVNKTCQALTLKGNRCTFKSVNGCFCKKHSLTKAEGVLGIKPKLNV
jgi:hypothetical protein